MILLPEMAAILLLVAVVIIAHTELIMVAGSAILRRFARPQRHQE
jgi:hypothetical protein